jgi:TM2 domain-containing membrane protein YozV
MIKKIASNLVLALLAIVIFTSCSVEKRQHETGFYIEWYKNNKTTVVQKKNEKSEKVNVTTIEKSDLPSELLVIESNKALPNFGKANKLQPIVKSFSSKVNLNTSETTVISNNVVSKLDSEKSLNKTTKTTKKQSDKNWLITLLLCFFLGALGIHRFYLGYTWQGVVQLLTGGGCGIWALIDFIRIIMKDLKPVDGDYTDSF